MIIEASGKSMVAMARCARQHLSLPRILMTLLGGLSAATGCDRPIAENSVSHSPAPVQSDTQALPVRRFFVDVTAESGIHFRRIVTDADRYFMPDVMGSGCAIFDYDNDGELDLYFVQSGPNPAAVGHDSQNRDARNCLYRRDADGRYTDVTEESGLGDTGYGMGVAVGDVDNDGNPDVYVTNFGADRLYRNNGNGTFSDITQLAGIDSPGWGTSVAFFDYNRDGWLDVFVVNYVDYNASQKCTNLNNSGADYCSPVHYPTGTDRLFRNNGRPTGGEVTFTDVTVESGIAAAGGGAGLGIVCADFTEDGYPDVYIANDLGPNFLWVNRQDGTFGEEAVERGCAVNCLGEPEASMGIAVGDADGDGDLDLFVTDLFYEANTLYLNQGGGYFEDATARSGLGPASVPYTAFGTVWMDLENDGDLDLPIANGRVFRGDVLPGADLGPFWNDYAEPNQLFINDGSGNYADMTSAAGDLAAAPNVGRGLAAGDLDGDGDLDLVLSGAAGLARVYRNDAPDPGHWLLVRAVDPQLQRDALGAEIRLDLSGRLDLSDRSHLRLVQSCSSYLCSHDVRCHFGLGLATEYSRISVRWPDGLREEFPGGSADRVVVLLRGSGRAALSETPTSTR